MRFQLLGDWPVAGGICIPGGTILDSSDPQYLGMPLPAGMPLNAKALDQEAYDELVRIYGEEFLHLLQYASHIKPKGPRQ